MSGTFPSIDNLDPPKEYKSIKEGHCIVLSDPSRVFYNNVQVFNRDSSILAISQYIKQLKEENKFPEGGVRILEALSATGLRSIRYWHEIEGIKEIIANDLDQTAVEDIQRNIEFNHAIEGIKVNHADATDLMYANRTTSLKERNEGFDIVDLDPYGTASPFIDAAVQCVKIGGLLCVTCTDLAVLAGNHHGTCYAKYAAVPTRGQYCHEMALRMVLNSIQIAAQKYKRYIEPLYSFQVDFYVRMFVRIHESPKVVKTIFKKMGYISQCRSCPAFEIQPVGKNSSKLGNCVGASINISHECRQCGDVTTIGGPMWIDSIHKQSFVENMLEDLKQNSNRFATSKRIEGILTVASAELQDTPLFYNIPSLSKALKSSTPSKYLLRSALINAGFNVSKCHVDPNGFKTNAPQQVIFDIFRTYAEQNRDSNVIHSEGTIPFNIMARKGDTLVDFTIHPASKLLDTVPVYFPNPEKNWGPKARAKGKRVRDENEELHPTKKIKQDSDSIEIQAQQE